MEKYANIQREFMGARVTLIQMTNQGRLGLKCRGKKKDERLQEFTESWKRSLEVAQSAGTANRTKYKAMTLQRYKDTHGGKCPIAAGEEISVQFHNGKLQECVLFRVQAEGEWELEVEDRVQTTKREVVDDGTAILREEQLQKTV